MKKILFIEDETTLQETLGERLKREGYEVVSAMDGETGLSLAYEGRPDLILLDILLPVKDGFEVLKEIKSDKRTKDIPVIILTNRKSAEDIEKVLHLGATNYLVKTNYKISEIVEKIESILSGL